MPVAMRKSANPRITDTIRLIPSEEIGEYEEPEKPPEPFKRPPGGGLFPLDEEGKYGPPPIYGYTRRVRKPKVYASYAISSQSDQDQSEVKNKTSSKSWISSTSTSSSTFSSVCPSPRSSSLSRPPSRLSNSPAPSFNSSRTSKSPSPGSGISKSPLRSNRRVPSPSPDRQSQKARCVGINSNKNSENVNDDKSVVRRIAREVKAQNSFNSNKVRSSSLKIVARNMRDSSFEENEEYDLKSNGLNARSAGRGASLAALREPAFPTSAKTKTKVNINTKVNTNTKVKINTNTTNYNNNNNWNCATITSKRQSNISKSIVRKTSYTSHAM